MSSRKATTSLDLVNILLHYAAGLGLDTVEIMKASGFPNLESGTAQDRIPIERLAPLWQEVLRQSGDVDFGLHLGEASQKYANGGILLAVMMNCATLAGALQSLTRYHNLATDFVQLHLYQEGETASLFWETNGSAVLPERHYAEMVFCNLVFMIRRLTQNTLQPLEIHFQHTRPADITEHERIFACRLAFGCLENELLLRREDLRQPIFLANPILLDKLEQFAREMLERLYPADSWADKVTRMINKNLLDGEKPALPALAAALSLSPRQLQNLLSREGYTFQGLLEQVRKESAMRSLDDPQTSICDVAFLLGFTEQSTFNHAFKRWTGLTPGNYRIKQSRQDAA